MSVRYTEGDGKRKSSQTHARRGWTCPCGRTVHGNGGISSHRRACQMWAEHRLARVEKTLAEMDAGTWGRGFSLSMAADYRHQFELDRDRLRKRLGRAI